MPIRTCTKCGNQEFVQKMTAVTVHVGCDQELQVHGAAAVLICTKCSEVSVPTQVRFADPRPQQQTPKNAPPLAPHPGTNGSVNGTASSAAKKVGRKVIPGKKRPVKKAHKKTAKSRMKRA